MTDENSIRRRAVELVARFNRPVQEFLECSQPGRVTLVERKEQARDDHLAAAIAVLVNANITLRTLPVWQQEFVRTQADSLLKDLASVVGSNPPRA